MTDKKAKTATATTPAEEAVKYELYVRPDQAKLEQASKVSHIYTEKYQNVCLKYFLYHLNKLTPITKCIIIYFCFSAYFHRWLI